MIYINDDENDYSWHDPSEEMPRITNIKRKCKEVLCKMKARNVMSDSGKIVLYYNNVAGFCVNTTYYSEYMIPAEDIEKWMFIPD